ncbi:MAG TPA: hypothetical protein DCP90_06345 [Clostridiales bacterium]|nr:MAG: hypothetical protein A2Y22_00930 [Clostridiales bacterium GWD2_32_59]HAN10215.1 hypothetical protein [Clostridiales bacterium]
MPIRGLWGIHKNNETKFIEIEKRADPEYAGEIITEAIRLMKRIYEEEYVQHLEKIFYLIEYSQQITDNSDIVIIISNYIKKANKEILIKEPIISIYDGTYCEWAYVINLDDETFEVYRGLNDKKDLQGRYFLAEPRGKHYAPGLFKKVCLKEIKI